MQIQTKVNARDDETLESRVSIAELLKNMTLTTDVGTLRHDEEPIAALASGTGAAAIAIVRLSGQDCHKLLHPCLSSRGRAPWQDKVMRLCQLVDPYSGEVLDEPMAVMFTGPHSYTGQDSAEIYLHGGPYIVQRTLAMLYRSGFRPAEPGEFTRRAFLSAKLDLTAAEGIGELIAASSHQQWLAARQLASGRLREAIENLRTLLMEAMAWLEARIDFPDEGETSAIEMQQVEMRVDRVKEALSKLAETYESGRVASRGLMVALLGQPNAGKSTLMNALLGSERAIVTEVAGTTRDYLEEPCLVNGRLIRLVDTAGIRNHGFDAIEKIGIERSLKVAREADVVLFLAPCDGPEASLQEITDWTQNLSSHASYLKVLTKGDLGTPSWLPAEDNWLRVSCKDQVGLTELKAALAAKVDAYVGELKEETFITSARHQAALEKALQALERFYQSLGEGAYEEMLAFELQEAAKALASIIGQVDSDEILGVIFSSFCVGK